MSETDAVQVLVGDCMSFEFPRHYQLKAFLADATRLKDLARKQSREPFTEAEVAEVAELRKRIRRADADAAMLLVIESGCAAAFNSSDRPHGCPGRQNSAPRCCRAPPVRRRRPGGVGDRGFLLRGPRHGLRRRGWAKLVRSTPAFGRLI